MRRLSVTSYLLVALCGALSGCEVFYNIGMQDSARKCDDLATPEQRAECKKNYSKSFDDYEKDRRRAVDGEPAKKRDSLCFRKAQTGELVCPN